MPQRNPYVAHGDGCDHERANKNYDGDDLFAPYLQKWLKQKRKDLIVEAMRADPSLLLEVVEAEVDAYLGNFPGGLNEIHED
tara:strand:- start:13 stop:258 length:246 start_codon:yes stop_codon:yes gene_type:complete